MKSILDDRRRSELLCHLVVAQLVSRVRCNEWLRAIPLVESQRRWSHMNGVSPDGPEGVRLGHVSQQLAISIWDIELLRNVEVLATLFTDTGRLDYQSPIVRGISEVCTARLASWRYEL
jgi:hypothetical protein